MDNSASYNFNKLYQAYYNRCFLFARSYVHDDLVAEDIASESLIRLWELTQEQLLDNPLKMLYTISRNKALDHLRHEKVRQEALATISDLSRRELEIRISTLEAGDPQKIFAADIQRIVEGTLAALPPQTRQIFEMYRFRNQPKSEIAARYQITVKGVDYHLSKAMSALRENLGDYFPFFLYFIINIF